MNKSKNISRFQRELPLWLTWSRILVVPVLMVLMSFQSPVPSFIAAVLFGLASFTDYLDGYFARAYGTESNMGKLMDPIADKILVSSLLIALIPLNRMSPWIPIILLARDMFIGGIRSVAASDQVVIAAQPAGKWKTGLQMVAIPGLLLTPLPKFLEIAATVILWISVVLSIVSGMQYYQIFLKSRGVNFKS